MRITGLLVAVNNCTFRDNTADLGGAVYDGECGETKPRFTHCLFLSNLAQLGGAIYASCQDQSRTDNCLFSGNSAAEGAAIYSFSISFNVASCTLRNNMSQSGGAIHGPGTSGLLTVQNTILWGNASPPIQYGGSAVVRYSLIEGGWTGMGGDGIVDADPRYVDADGIDNIVGTDDDDLRIQAGSPAIDAGHNGFLNGVTVDLNGQPRKVDDPSTTDSGSGTAPIVDIGAYEWQIPCPADLTDSGGPDGEVNVFDLFVLLGNWNTNGQGADLAPDENIVDVFDLFVMLKAWGPCD